MNVRLDIYADVDEIFNIHHNTVSRIAKRERETYEEVKWHGNDKKYNN